MAAVAPVAGSVTGDPNAVSDHGALDLDRAAGLGAARDGARHAAVVVDQQRAVTNHGVQARASTTLLRRQGPGLERWTPTCQLVKVGI
jgi:hypothetical protein